MPFMLALNALLKGLLATYLPTTTPRRRLTFMVRGQRSRRSRTASRLASWERLAGHQERHLEEQNKASHLNDAPMTVVACSYAVA
jgi:hypothetical protein